MREHSLSCGQVGKSYMKAYNVFCYLNLASLNQGQKALQSLTPEVSSDHSKAVHVDLQGCAQGVAENWLGVVKPHCHLFLMSFPIIKCVLSSGVA